jgi:hypothetical protein
MSDGDNDVTFTIDAKRTAPSLFILQLVAVSTNTTVDGVSTVVTTPLSPSDPANARRRRLIHIASAHSGARRLLAPATLRELVPQERCPLELGAPGGPPGAPAPLLILMPSAGGWGGGMELACQSVLTLLVNFGFLVFGCFGIGCRSRGFGNRHRSTNRIYYRGRALRFIINNILISL